MPWLDVLVCAIAAVSWALIGMAGTAALGLHLLGADTAGSLGPMTAAVVALGAGGSVTPSGDVSAFGLTGAEATTAIEITPLGVSLVGALLLSWFFLRSLRTAGVVIAPAELLARAGAVVALFTATMGGLAWAGHDVITIDGGSLGLDDLPGGGGAGGGGVGGVEIPGLGELGDIGGLLPDRLGDLVDARAAVGFGVDTAPTLLGGLGWSAGVLLIALLASRRTPLPRGWEAVHRVVRPAVSAVVTVLLVAVAAGFAAAAYAAVGDDHPRRIAGAALLGAPNGVWLGIDLGLLVPWHGHATGALTNALPAPLDDLLTPGTDRPVTLGRLAELDSRVWLLGVATAVLMLLAGVLTAVRMPGGAGGVGAGGWGAGGWGAGGPGSVGSGAGGRGSGVVGFVGRCALGLGVATAVALPLLAWLTDVSVDASLSVLGFDAFGAGVDLHGHLGMALLLGAAWGTGAGAVGALLARATGAAGGRATALARWAVGVGATAGGAGTTTSGGVWTTAGGAGATAGGAGTTTGGMGSTAGGPGAATGRAFGATVGGVGTTASWPGPGAAPGGAGAVAGAAGAPAGGAGTAVGGPGAAAGRAGATPGGAGTTAGGPGAAAGGAGTAAGGAGAGGGYSADAGGGHPGAGYPGGGGAPPPGGGRRGRGGDSVGDSSGPYAPGVPYRPPNPATNPYLRVPEHLREPEDARPPRGDGFPDAGGPPTASPGSPPAPDGSRSSQPPDGSSSQEGIYDAPTMIRPVGPPPPPPRPPKRRPADDGPPPPPPPAQT
ncbi:streptophobe family protein [Streptomyces sp. NPDC002328]|uniref:streptophobe family protein n=1 Tax=Streptomyces sp. NPDC002328 TaxID=3364642 RepID=UPI00369B2506